MEGMEIGWKDGDGYGYGYRKMGMGGCGGAGCGGMGRISGNKMRLSDHAQHSGTHCDRAGFLPLNKNI